MTEYPREVYDLVKQQLDEQFRHQDAFDSKAFFLFGAILVVIGFLVDKQTVASSPVLFWCGLAMLALSLFGGFFSSWLDMGIAPFIVCAPR